VLRSGKPFHPEGRRQSLRIKEGLQTGLVGGPTVKIVPGVNSAGDEDRFNAIVERPANIGMDAPSPITRTRAGSDVRRGMVARAKVPSAPRPRRRPSCRVRRKNRWRDHHSRHRQGKAAGRRNRRRRPRRTRRFRQAGQPLDVKAGDRVLFGKWSGTEVKIDGEDLLIMKESDIMGVIG
jgi:hypothetical protein